MTYVYIYIYICCNVYPRSGRRERAGATAAAAGSPELGTCAASPRTPSPPTKSFPTKSL